MKVLRGTKGGAAPGWQGAKMENTGSILLMSNAASRDAAPAGRQMRNESQNSPDAVWCEKAAEARSVLVESPK